MKYLLLLLLSFSAFSAEINELRKFKKEIAELKSVYAGIDSVIDGAGLPAGIATEMKDEAKLKIKAEMKQRLYGIIDGAIKAGIEKHDAEIKEEKCMKSLEDEDHYAAALAALPDGDCAALSARS